MRRTLTKRYKTIHCANKDTCTSFGCVKTQIKNGEISVSLPWPSIPQGIDGHEVYTRITTYVIITP